MSAPPPANAPARPWPTALAVLAPVAAIVGWVYWPAFVLMFEKWTTDPQYSHGYLVPLFSIGYLIWKRNRLDFAKVRADWRGLPLVVLGAAAYVVGGYTNVDYLATGSLLPTLAGVALLLGGPAALRWAWPAIAFLGFMLPLPFRIETALGAFLQGKATQGSTWLLQLLGFPAAYEGNVIVLEHGRISVIEACSGLSMLMIFLAIATGMAMVIRRPLVDRIVLVLSAIPVALAANILRISSNGIAIETWNSESAHQLFHDQGGLMMMPLAVCMLWLELWVLKKLFVEVGPKPAAAK